MIDDNMDLNFWVEKLRRRMPLPIDDVIRQIASDPVVEIDREIGQVIVGNVTDAEWDRIVEFMPLGIALRRKN